MQTTCRHPKWAERKVHAMTLDVLMEMDEDADVPCPDVC